MKLLRINSMINALSNVNRFSGQTLHRPESVLEHTACVSMFSLFIARQIEEYGREANIVVNMNWELLLKKALLHDIEESSTGDIARPVKYHSEEIRVLIGQMEEEAVADFMNSVGENRLMKTWKESKKGREGSIVACADGMAVVYKLYDEVAMRGNVSIMPVMDSRFYHKMDSKFDRIAELYSLPVEVFEDFKADCREMIDEIGYTN